MHLKDQFKNSTMLFDGAMGTFLQNSGMKLGELPEALNITRPELIESIHLKYLEAGANILSANTFGANRLKVQSSGYTVKEVVDSAVNCARRAIETYHQTHHTHKEAKLCANHKYIALDLGPIGQLLEPMGTLSFDQAYELYKEQVLAGVEAGCDLFIIETQTDLLELKCAVLACQENSELPIVASMSFEQTGRTFTGTNVESMVTLLDALDVDALGFNCSFGPKEMIPLVKEAIGLTNKPIVVQANAGLPKRINQITVYDTTADEYSEVIKSLLEIGVTVLGGCCGTDDHYIAKVKKVIDTYETTVIRNAPVKTRVSSYAKTVVIGEAPIVIGERLNPTGKKRLKEALRNHDIDYILKEAISQVDQGAHILDVNIGLPELDEAQLMPEIIKEIQTILDVPLQIDSSNINCLEQASRRYNGKPLINSVNGKEDSLNAILPIVKKYGACVLGLTLDDDGIPSQAIDRFNIAKKIVDRAVQMGIPKENVLIDCLALTASAQQADVIETIKAIKMVKEELGVATVLGVSNVSFGLPNRDLINKTFLTMALMSGLDAPIINPGHSNMMDAIDAYKVLADIDKDSKLYIQRHAADAQSTQVVKPVLGDVDLKTIIMKGLKEEATAMTDQLLQTMKPMQIIDEMIIPTLNDVGDAFEKGQIFLPQLIQSAETVHRAFERLKLELLKDKTLKLSKGKIVLATVHHDVHDIGKNIVKVILQNYGYDVIDLGKDVPPQVVLDACILHDVKLVGLSALMTSTVESMAETIRVLKFHDPSIEIIVGGAVLNPEYAQMIHADHYAKDARETALIANHYFAAKG